MVASPGTFAVLAALAAVTEHIGLVGSVDPTVNEPFEVSRQLATLDHLSAGRAGWQLTRPAHEFGVCEFADVVRAFFSSWETDAVLADLDTGIYLDPNRIHSVERSDVRGMATLPAGPQGHPVLVVSGDSEAGLGAELPDAVIAESPAGPIAHGRNGDQPTVFAPFDFVVGEDTADIAERIDRVVQSDACDGFIVPQDRLDEVVDLVVPLLQERGVFRTAYPGMTLRETLTSGQQPARPVPGSGPATHRRGRG